MTRSCHTAVVEGRVEFASLVASYEPGCEESRELWACLSDYIVMGAGGTPNTQTSPARELQWSQLPIVKVNWQTSSRNPEV